MQRKCCLVLTVHGSDESVKSAQKLLLIDMTHDHTMCVHMQQLDECRCSYTTKQALPAPVSNVFGRMQPMTGVVTALHAYQHCCCKTVMGHTCPQGDVLCHAIGEPSNGA